MPLPFVLDDAKEDDDEEEEERNAREEHEDIIASRDAIIVGSSLRRKSAPRSLSFSSFSLCLSFCFVVRAWLKRGSQEADLIP